MSQYACVILAAGEGTRMKSARPKVLHPVCGIPMVGHVLRLVEGLGIKRTAVVAGFQIDIVKRYIGKRANVLNQRERKGSGHALMQARKFLKNAPSNVLVLYGDTPLLDAGTLRQMLYRFQKEKASCALTSAIIPNPTGYGRVLRNGNGTVSGIVEELSATPSEKTIREINVGAYCFRKEKLFEALNQIKPDARKREYYLTDAVKLLTAQGRVICIQATSAAEALGINSRRDLATAERKMRQRILERWMDAGVTIEDPATTYISADVKIGRDTIIRPCTVIEGPSTIGADCEIGPFAHIRSGVHLEAGVTIGNFVEVTRSRVGKSTLIKHLSYIGDAQIGREVNVGAGSITANFDGKKKHTTKLGNQTQIGSGTVLVAPVTMQARSKTGAGAVVTRGKTVPSGSTVVGVPAKALRKARKR